MRFLEVAITKNAASVNAENKDHFDFLLAARYTANAVDFPVLIDNEKALTSNPVVTINGVIYLPIQELEEELGIKVSRNIERQFEITTKVLFANLSNDREYAAIVTGIPVLIDNGEALTSNPVVTINGVIYLPIQELEEEIGIKVDRDEDIRQLDGGYVIQRNIKSLEITTSVKEGLTSSKNKEVIVRLKEDIIKLSKGMTRYETEQVLGKATPDPNAIERSISEPVRYTHKDGVVLYVLYDDSNKVSAIFNQDGIDLLATGHIAILIDFPVLIDGDESLNSNPIVVIHHQLYAKITVYVPIEDLAEQLGIKVNFNEEKQQLEITTK